MFYKHLILIYRTSINRSLIQLVNPEIHKILKFRFNFSSNLGDSFNNFRGVIGYIVSDFFVGPKIVPKDI